MTDRPQLTLSAREVATLDGRERARLWADARFAVLKEFGLDTIRHRSADWRHRLSQPLHALAIYCRFHGHDHARPSAEVVRAFLDAYGEQCDLAPATLRQKHGFLRQAYRAAGRPFPAPDAVGLDDVLARAERRRAAGRLAGPGRRTDWQASLPGLDRGVAAEPGVAVVVPDALPVKVADLMRVAAAVMAHEIKPQTRHNYAVWWRAFAGWCVRHGREAFPADPRTLVAFLADGHLRGLTAGSLRCFVNAISFVHARAAPGLTDPARHGDVRALLRGLAKAATRPAQKARPLAPEEVRAICAAVDADALDGEVVRNPRALMLSAQIKLAYMAALRASEATKRRHDDFGEQTAVIAEVVERRETRITIGSYTIDPDGMHFHLSRTKGGAEGGETLFVPAGFVKATCPVVAVRRVEAFLKAVGAYRTGAPLFPSVRERDPARGIVHVGVTPCGADVFLRALKYYARAAGVATERLGTHSLRRGHAHEAVRQGAELGDLQRALRHVKTETTLGYIDEVERVLRHTGTLLGI